MKLGKHGKAMTAVFQVTRSCLELPILHYFQQQPVVLGSSSSPTDQPSFETPRQTLPGQFRPTAGHCTSKQGLQVIPKPTPFKQQR